MNPGIGEATAKLAASKGAKVMVSDLNDEQGEAVAQAIRDDGGEAAYQHCDVTNPDEVSALMAATAESCTGGMVAAALTDIAGSSAVVDRGFVTYSNEAKWSSLARTWATSL